MTLSDWVVWEHGRDDSNFAFLLSCGAAAESCWWCCCSLLSIQLWRHGLLVFHTTSAKIHCAVIRLNFITGLWSSGLDEKCYLSACGQTSGAPVDFTYWKPVSGVLVSQAEVWLGGSCSSLLGLPFSKATVNISDIAFQSPIVSLVQQQFFSPVGYWEEKGWLGEQRRSVE